MQKDVQIIDLYTNEKLGIAAERLPREIVLEYAWMEEIDLKKYPTKGYDFGEMNGKSIQVTCGGTLVFDERGNILSWFSKPGMEDQEHPKKGPNNVDQKSTEITKIKKNPEETGSERMDRIIQFIAENTRANRIGIIQSNKGSWTGFKPYSAFILDNSVQLEMTPQMRAFFEEEGI